MKIGHTINYLFHYIEYIRKYKCSLNNIVTFIFINIFINIYIIYNFINNKKYLLFIIIDVKEIVMAIIPVTDFI